MQPCTVRGQRLSSTREWHQIALRPVLPIVAIIAILAAPCAEASNLAVDPQTPATLYHGSERVFKSTDGGATWSPRNAGFPRQEEVALMWNVLAMDPTKPRIRTRARKTSACSRPRMARNTGVRINTGLSPVQRLVLTPFTALAVDPNTLTTLYAAAGQGMVGVGGRLQFVGRLYKSTDGGVKWALSSAGLSDPNNLSIVIAPQVPRIIFATTTENGVMKSSDAWCILAPDRCRPDFLERQRVGHRPAQSGHALRRHRRPRRLQEHRRRGELERGGSRDDEQGGPDAGHRSADDIDDLRPTAAGNVAAVFRSVDAGENWQALSRMPRAFAPAFAIDAVAPSTLYRARRRASVQERRCRSRPGTRQRRADTLGVRGDGSTRVLRRADAARAGGEQAFFKSTNGGATWARSDSGLNDSVIKLVADPRSSATLTPAGNQGLFKSTDGGASWKRKRFRSPARERFGGRRGY